ncbi:MAG: sigma-54-dependent Fis family transcriptional regulator [Desulfobacteraceae bacterium]|nr:MAG: sigma-54-dependent Fis family transcriptional regulator [Desulfobacteraceae bacterium]
MNNRNILIIEPNVRERSGLSSLLEDWGYYVTTSHDEADALSKIKSEDYALVISDYMMPGGQNGADLIRHIHSISETTRILFISLESSVRNAVEAIKAGAIDYLVKPVDEAQMQYTLEKALCENQPENGSSSRQTNGRINIITKNKTVLHLLDLSRQIANSTASVFIQGESGTGKELFARYIHEAGNRKNGPFIAVNCAALPETLLESELFGHEKGSFTGAISQKPGKFELADKGTILLDEITEMQLHLQSKLLRIIQEHEVDRVGGLKPVKIDVRIIATSNRNISQTVKEGKFREDLYFRLNTIPITIPPLRMRPEDIEPLVLFLISKYNRVDGRNVKTLTKPSLDILKNLRFNGNVRELENIIQRAVLLSDGQTIQEKDLFLENQEPAVSDLSGNTEEPAAKIMVEPLKEIEKKMIFQTLDQTHGNRTHAAKILGISVRTLRNKLNEYREFMESV